MKPIISVLAIAGIFSITSCSNSANREAAATKQRTIDSLNTELTKKKVVDSMNEIARMQSYPMPVITPVAPGINPAPVQPVVAHTRTVRGRTHHYSGSNGSVAQGGQTTVYQQAPVAPRKRGWSAKAKGAVIGAGAGAITGAVIDRKNRGAGAVIGGLLGAGAGTGVGAIIDKKKGR